MGEGLTLKGSIMTAGFAFVALGCGSDSAPTGREARYRAFATRFGAAPKAGNAPAAYEMTARPLRAKMDAAAFGRLLGEARGKYGAATTIGVSSNTFEADGPLGEGLGFPAGVFVKERARMVIRMANGPDPHTECLYEVWINVGVEGGQDRVVTVEIPGINL